MRFLLLVAVLVSACVPRPDPMAQQAPEPIVGTVERVDLTPMAVDGDAEVTLRTSDGERVEIRVPARQNLCEATGLGMIGSLRAGDRLEVVGAMRGEEIVPCESATHRLRRPDYSGGTFEGAFVAGFETSGFRPCEQPEANWWVVPTEDLMAQYRGLPDQSTGRGLGPFARIVVAGELSEPGDRGPFGGWGRELIVTDVVTVEYLAPGDGEWPTIPCAK
ncbi:MAG: hypothetical protein AAGI52_11050 [Bacteroidota bacterium]